MAGHQYHFGRISTITNKKTGAKSFRTGPVQDPSGLSYKGARGANIDHVIRLVKKIKGNDVTIATQGRLYPGKPEFRWVGELWDKATLLSQLQDFKTRGYTMERVAEEVFGLKNGRPDLVLTWEVREHK